jgi:biotin carboxyl carrier protein
METPINAPIAGKIVSVMVKVGDDVKENDQIAIMEAMKMQIPLVSPIKGVVKDICVTPGQEVEAGTKVAALE